ncbi:hypothetical protein ACE2AJ_16560 [Aquihabitans daechungensis]|uniref:sunset domain-containing protein n=1 Tax=Aquihabitans daechungensis TaxID=1052257 RepID=UPI003BA2EC65
MRGGKVRKLAVLIVIGAIVTALVKKLRGDPAPQFGNHPTVTGGPAKDPVRQPQPAARPAPEDPTVPAPGDTTLVPAPADPTLPEDDSPAAPTAPTPSAASAESAASPETGEQSWVPPVDGACPDGYPVKAKVKSGIFHQPGGVAYERTKPDRCYPSAAAAEADGLRPPKR